jgi:uncharacterized membrane protein
MKTFLKKNWLVLLLCLVGALILFLGSIFNILLPIGMLVLAVPMGIWTVRSKKKYDKMKNIDESKYIFDATKLDYDEEVYFVGNESEKKVRTKNIFAKFNAVYPVIIFGFLCVAFVIMAIMGFVSVL